VSPSPKPERKPWELAGNGRQEFVQLLAGEVDALAQIQNSNLPTGTFADAIKEAWDATSKVSAEYEIGGTSKIQELVYDLQMKLAKSASEAADLRERSVE
jgi:hypothetical protein